MKNGTLYGTAVLISTLGLGLAGCNGRDPNLRAPIVNGNEAVTDPANANMVPTQVAGVSYAAQPQATGTSYAPVQYVQTAPQQQRTTQNEAYQYNTQPPQYAGDPNAQYDPNAQQGYDQQAANAAEYAEYDSLLDPNVPATDQAPPPLPADFEQPPAPADDYLWTPGYWDNSNAGYYYVPGVWVAPPYVGALWTPGWWGAYGGRYRWHHGYWGRHIGFYGGVNYGFGYVGYGYQGGYWNGDHFWYNRSVNRFGGGYQPHYVYNRPVEVVNRTYINNTRVSYFGGNGGLRRGPVQQERGAIREQHVGPMQSQVMHREQAMGNRAQFFNQNHGRPAMVTASQPLPAQRGIAAPPRTMPAMNNGARPGNEMRPGEGFRGAPGNASPQQRQQMEQQRQQFQNQQHLQQNMNQPGQPHGFFNGQQVQHQQVPNEHGAQTNPQNREQMQRAFEQQRNEGNQQQRVQQEQQQHTQQMQQQRSQQVQERSQQTQQQRGQQEQQRSQQMQMQQHTQQMQEQQHTQQMQEQQHTQQMQQQQHTQQMQQQQHTQQMQQMQQQSAQQEQQRSQQMQQHMQEQHAAPQMRSAPPPQMHSAPPPQPHPAGGGGGEHRR